MSTVLTLDPVVRTTAAFTEFEVVTLEMPRWGLSCGAIVTADSRPNAQLTLVGGGMTGLCRLELTPERWGRYNVTLESGGDKRRATLDFWPVAYETVVAWDVAIPIAGLYSTPTGDEIAIYGEPMTPRAEDWYDAVSQPGLDAEARAADGISFADHQEAPRRAYLIDQAKVRGLTLRVNYAGYGRIRALGNEWVMHTVEGGSTAADPDQFWRWEDHTGPVRTPIWGPPPRVETQQWMVLDHPHTGVVDWEADDFDNYDLLNVQDSILEPVGQDESRLVMAYQTGVNSVAILHMPVVGGYRAGPFERPSDCDPATADRTAATPCEPFVGDGPRNRYGVDTPWFFPEFVEPFDQESLRLTALYHPTARTDDMRENTGWSSWRRPVGAAQEVWEYEGMFFTLDHSQEGLRNDPDVHFTEDDHTCAQGDHTIVTLDGVDYMYVPVGAFRGWWPSLDSERQAEYESRFIDFIAQDVLEGNEIYYTVHATGTKHIFTAAELIQRFSLRPSWTTADDGFDCRYCIVYGNRTKKSEKWLPVAITDTGRFTAGGYRIFELSRADSSDPNGPNEADWRPLPCDLVLGNAFYDVVAKEWDASAFVDPAADQEWAHAALSALCSRYCMDIPLVLATSRAIGA